MTLLAPFENGRTVFGEAVPPDFLVERIASFDWRESFVRLANLAAIVANHEDGATSEPALRLTSTGLNALTASSPAAAAMLARGRQYLATAGRTLILAHEEALVFLEHMVLVHSGEGGEAPSDAELSLWLLAAGDHLEPWFEEDARSLDETERLAAELVKVFRFNRSSVDGVRLLLRAEGLFGRAPCQGFYADQAAWTELQERAFGSPFARYFEAFVVPLTMLSHSWGKRRGSKEHLPILGRSAHRESFGAEGPYFVDKLASLASTRDELRKAILKRMRPGGLLPHAPTALLRTPFVELDDDALVAASPWYVRAVARTGIWSRYLIGAKAHLGDQRGSDDWSSAFGYMLEDWCGRYARRAEGAAKSTFRIELPSRSGAKDEIEDVVSFENDEVALFSVKARLVREDIARHALSRSKLLDWYEDFFFKQKTAKFRAGVVAQLSSRVDMIRSGKFDRVPASARIAPVLVTFDNLCDNLMLSAWLNDRCKHHGLLQQQNVGPLTLAVIDDYERLMAAPSQGKSVAEILRSRSSQRLKNERLDVVLYGHDVESRLPGTDAEYDRLMDRVMAGLRRKPDSSTDIRTASP